MQKHEAQSTFFFLSQEQQRFTCSPSFMLRTMNDKLNKNEKVLEDEIVYSSPYLANFFFFFIEKC